LFDIVDAIDGDGFTTGCLMGFPECTGKNPCSVHGLWEDIRKDLRSTLADKNIAQMAKEMKKTEYKSVG
jgi:DNA-binding IscR family transcriptional regulator